MSRFSPRKLLPLHALAIPAMLFLMSSMAFSADLFEILNTRETAVLGDVVDVAATDDGSWSFVLTTRGEIVVLDPAGRITQTIEVGQGYEHLEYVRSSNRLLLGGGQGKLKIITLAMRYDIDTSGSPSRGPKDAPVTIAVFTDYQ